MEILIYRSAYRNKFQTHLNKKKNRKTNNENHSNVCPDHFRFKSVLFSIEKSVWTSQKLYKKCLEKCISFKFITIFLLCKTQFYVQTFFDNNFRFIAVFFKNNWFWMHIVNVLLLYENLLDLIKLSLTFRN